VGSCWGEESTLGDEESALGDEEDGDDIERRRTGGDVHGGKKMINKGRECGVRVGSVGLDATCTT
jgi:hypothetical protein